MQSQRTWKQPGLLIKRRNPSTSTCCLFYPWRPWRGISALQFQQLHRKLKIFVLFFLLDSIIHLQTKNFYQVLAASSEQVVRSYYNVKIMINKSFHYYGAIECLGIQEKPSLSSAASFRRGHIHVLLIVWWFPYIVPKKCAPKLLITFRGCPRIRFKLVV